MKLTNKLIKIYYTNGNESDDRDIKLYFYFNAFLKIVEDNKQIGDGLRVSMRRFIEDNFEEMDADVDYEDPLLDIFYELPIFEDLRVEEERDIYFYQDFNTNRQVHTNDDYLLSIKTFQKILEDSDLIAMYMSIFKIYNYILTKDNDNYTKREERLIDASNYLLKQALNNLIG